MGWLFCKFYILLFIFNSQTFGRIINGKNSGESGSFCTGPIKNTFGRGRNINYRISASELSGVECGTSRSPCQCPLTECKSSEAIFCDCQLGEEYFTPDNTTSTLAYKMYSGSFIPHIITDNSFITLGEGRHRSLYMKFNVTNDDISGYYMYSDKKVDFTIPKITYKKYGDPTTTYNYYDRLMFQGDCQLSPNMYLGTESPNFGFGNKPGTYYSDFDLPKVTNKKVNLELPKSSVSTTSIRQKATMMFLGYQKIVGVYSNEEIIDRYVGNTLTYFHANENNPLFLTHFSNFYTTTYINNGNMQGLMSSEAYITGGTINPKVTSENQYFSVISDRVVAKGTATKITCPNSNIQPNRFFENLIYTPYNYKGDCVFVKLPGISTPYDSTYTKVGSTVVSTYDNPLLFKIIRNGITTRELLREVYMFSGIGGFVGVSDQQIHLGLPDNTSNLAEIEIADIDVSFLHLTSPFDSSVNNNNIVCKQATQTIYQSIRPYPNGNGISFKREQYSTDEDLNLWVACAVSLEVYILTESVSRAEKETTPYGIKVRINNRFSFSYPFSFISDLPTTPALYTSEDFVFSSTTKSGSKAAVDNKIIYTTYNTPIYEGSEFVPPLPDRCFTYLNGNQNSTFYRYLHSLCRDGYINEDYTDNASDLWWLLVLLFIPFIQTIVITIIQVLMYPYYAAMIISGKRKIVWMELATCKAASYDYGCRISDSIKDNEFYSIVHGVYQYPYYINSSGLKVLLSDTRRKLNFKFFFICSFFLKNFKFIYIFLKHFPGYRQDSISMMTSNNQHRSLSFKTESVKFSSFTRKLGIHKFSTYLLHVGVPVTAKTGETLIVKKNRIGISKSKPNSAIYNKLILLTMLFSFVGQSTSVSTYFYVNDNTKIEYVYEYNLNYRSFSDFIIDESIICTKCSHNVETFDSGHVYTYNEPFPPIIQNFPHYVKETGTSTRPGPSIISFHHSVVLQSDGSTRFFTLMNDQGVIGTYSSNIKEIDDKTGFPMTVNYISSNTPGIQENKTVYQFWMGNMKGKSYICQSESPFVLKGESDYYMPSLALLPLKEYPLDTRNPRFKIDKILEARKPKKTRAFYGRPSVSTAENVEVVIGGEMRSAIKMSPTIPLNEGSSTVFNFKLKDGTPGSAMVTLDFVNVSYTSTYSHSAYNHKLVDIGFDFDCGWSLASPDHGYLWGCKASNGQYSPDFSSVSNFANFCNKYCGTTAAKPFTGKCPPDSDTEYKWKPEYLNHADLTIRDYPIREACVAWASGGGWSFGGFMGLPDVERPSTDVFVVGPPVVSYGITIKSDELDFDQTYLFSTDESVVVDDASVLIQNDGVDYGPLVLKNEYITVYKDKPKGPVYSVYSGGAMISTFQYSTAESLHIYGVYDAIEALPPDSTFHKICTPQLINNGWKVQCSHSTSKVEDSTYARVLKTVQQDTGCAKLDYNYQLTDKIPSFTLTQSDCSRGSLSYSIYIVDATEMRSEIIYCDVTDLDFKVSGYASLVNGAILSSSSSTTCSSLLHSSSEIVTTTGRVKFDGELSSNMAFVPNTNLNFTLCAYTDDKNHKCVTVPADVKYQEGYWNEDDEVENSNGASPGGGLGIGGMPWWLIMIIVIVCLLFLAPILGIAMQALGSVSALSNIKLPSYKKKNV